MFILSFSLQSYLLSTSTCADLWDSEKARAEITTETSNDEKLPKPQMMKTLPKPQKIKNPSSLEVLS
jgi:hypothetical protein